MAIDVEKTTSYWLESAAYDLETAKTLLCSKRYPYALFFGHLAIEKVLKALVVKQTGDHAPYSHSLVVLAGKTALEIPEAMIDQLAEFMEFHTEARYPDAKRLLPEMHQGICPGEEFREIKEVYTWLRKKSEK